VNLIRQVTFEPFPSQIGSTTCCGNGRRLRALNQESSFGASVAPVELGAKLLCRTSARLCRAAGGELEQIQFLLGHVSVQTPEHYLGCTQRISSAVND
jgi:hypothetical protein